MGNTTEDIIRRLDRIETFLLARVPKYMTVGEAATYLGFKPSRIKSMVENHELRYCKSAGTVIIERSSLDEWAHEHTILTDDDLRAKVNTQMKLKKIG